MEDMITQEDLDKCYTKKVRASGGFGQVDTFIILNYEGVPKEFPKQIAGKSALNELNEPEARREIHILKRLINEQNIVTLISYTKTSPTLILMECLNTDLSTFAKNRHFNLTQKDIFKISKDCLHALVSLRKHKIIHRDFKPGNLLIDFQGTDGANVQDLLIKLCDFGLSRIVNTEKMELGTMDLSMNRGTNGYMAPEITLLPRDDDSSGKYTHKVDIWGFGVTILFLVSKGQKPFIEEYLRELQSEYTNSPRRNKEIKATIKNNLGEEFGDVSVIISEVLKWLPEERKTAGECLTITEHREKNEFSTLQKRGGNKSASESYSKPKSEKDSDEDEDEGEERRKSKERILEETREREERSKGAHQSTSSFELTLQEPTTNEGNCTIRRWAIIMGILVLALLCVIIPSVTFQYSKQTTPLHSKGELSWIPGLIWTKVTLHAIGPVDYPYPSSPCSNLSVSLFSHLRSQIIAEVHSAPHGLRGPV